MKYYALDWAAMGFSLAALHCLGNRNRAGFLFFIAANLCWLAVGWLAASPAIICGNCAFALINARGYRKWPSPAA